MPSPFPGMNPYLEQEDAWHDFHERFLPLVAERIAAQVDPRYIVKIDEHIYIHELSAEQRRFLGRADITVGRGRSAAERQTATGVLEAPAEGYLPAVDVERLAFVEIRDRRNRQLVTLIELLSPANKRPGADRDQYLAKRHEVLASAAHFVEIDLLRGGRRPPVEDWPACDYCVLVSRCEQRPRVGIWPLRLSDRLPLVPIPLRAPDPDAQLDLQEALHDIYDKAHYQTYIYDGAPDPPLTPQDEVWARQFTPQPP
ncbi:MAG: DUF4058 family protein [Planctomycetota bacterium]|nr:DUF4058 family protein [Planctomycetota bacterium]